VLEIFYFDSLPSTHKYICELVKEKKDCSSLLVYADEQTQGVGSRGNRWQSTKGNLHVSMCVHMKHLPNDLPLVSVSIYAGMILKEIFHSWGSKVWLKWPNDFYIKKVKIGGIMTLKTGDFFIISMGVNLRSCAPEYGILDVQKNPKECIDALASVWQAPPSWKNIFSKYKLEFQHSRMFASHSEGEAISLKNAVLCEDGSLLLGNKKVYSLR
jgi:BirA family biotin operon repressor/biotin-[acetyl-CoA-carboxylase] ligase